MRININSLNDLKNQTAHRDKHTILTEEFKADVKKDFNKKNLSILQKHKSIRKNLNSLSPEQQDEFGKKAQKFRENHFENATLEKGLFGHARSFAAKARDRTSDLAAKARDLAKDNIDIITDGGSRKYLKQSKKRKSRKKTEKRNCRNCRKSKKRNCSKRNCSKRNCRKQNYKKRKTKKRKTKKRNCSKRNCSKRNCRNCRN